MLEFFIVTAREYRPTDERFWKCKYDFTSEMMTMSASSPWNLSTVDSVTESNVGNLESCEAKTISGHGHDNQVAYKQHLKSRRPCCPPKLSLQCAATRERKRERDRGPGDTFQKAVLCSLARRRGLATEEATYALSSLSDIDNIQCYHLSK